MSEIWMKSMLIIEPEVLHSNQTLYKNIVMDDWHLDEESLGNWQFIATLWIYVSASFHNKEWQMMLDLNLVLAILHGQFTISIEQDHRIEDTKYTI